MTSSLLGQLASDRHREMLARAQQQRLARRLGAFSKASRRAGRAERRLRRAGDAALRRRAELAAASPLAAE